MYKPKSQLSKQNKISQVLDNVTNRAILVTIQTYGRNWCSGRNKIKNSRYASNNGCIVHAWLTPRVVATCSVHTPILPPVGSAYERTSALHSSFSAGSSLREEPAKNNEPAAIQARNWKKIWREAPISFNFDLNSAGRLSVGRKQIEYKNTQMT